MTISCWALTIISLIFFVMGYHFGKTSKPNPDVELKKYEIHKQAEIVKYAIDAKLRDEKMKETEGEL